MNVILLSGGSGQRLWPISNDIRSKQFIKIFKTEDGNYESMLQRMYKNLVKIDKKVKITIATSESQLEQIKNQLENKVDISIEPSRKNTFPAIALATAYLHYEKKIDLEEPIIVCPADPYVDEEYFKTIKSMSDYISTSDTTNLLLMGINPTNPSEKFGYIIPEDNTYISNVTSFKEKPSKNVAEEYIKNNGLWNGGVFAFKLKYLIKKAHELIDFVDYKDLFNKYDSLEKISFDYAVVEKEKNIKVIRFNGKWDDLGTWDTLTEVLEENINGNAKLSESCENVHVINELDIPVVGIGLKDIIISVSKDGILISDKKESDEIKKYIE